jgi:hypothetical protein
MDETFGKLALLNDAMQVELAEDARRRQRRG